MLASTSRSRSLLLTLPSFRRASAARSRRGKGVTTVLELAVQPLLVARFPWPLRDMRACCPAVRRRCPFRAAAASSSCEARLGLRPGGSGESDSPSEAAAPFASSPPDAPAPIVTTARPARERLKGAPWVNGRWLGASPTNPMVPCAMSVVRRWRGGGGSRLSLESILKGRPAHWGLREFSAMGAAAGGRLEPHLAEQQADEQPPARRRSVRSAPHRGDCSITASCLSVEAPCRRPPREEATRLAKTMHARAPISVEIHVKLKFDKTGS